MARKLANHRRRIFASPRYLEGRTRPMVPNDLTQHNCLIVRQDDVAYGQWHFTKARKTQSIKVRGNLSSNDGAAVLTWALEGHGVIMRSEWDASPFVRAGQLEVLLDDELELADYEANFRRMFGDARMDAVIGSVEGSVRFHGLTPTSLKLEGLDRHQRLIDSYRKLHTARARVAGLAG